nr:glycosyltransferase [Paraflavitalea sp. H1-2-19X]
MPKPNTLVVITPAFPEHESATWWVPSQQLMVKALQENHPDTRITVLSLLHPCHEAIYQWHGITVQAFDGLHKPNIKKWVLYRKVWRALQQLQQQCHIIGLFSCWNGESALLAQYFGKRYGIPHISWICGQDAKRSNWWVKLIRPHGDQLAAMGTTLRDRYERSHGIRPRHLVPNAIDPRSFPAVWPATRDIDIMAAGSFEPLKQYDQYTYIINRLRQTLPGLQAIHCGIGREQPKVEALINELQLHDHLRLLGGKPHADILALMQRSRLFLHTSHYEGCSTVCLEALYGGAHVISYCYPFDHAVPHWHVVKDAAEMEAKALELLQDAQLVHERILYQTMEDSARALMQLFRPETTVDSEYKFPTLTASYEKLRT